mgnify:CR=1 FL=1
MIDFPQPELINSNGIQLEVYQQGAGRPLLLCHGWPEHAYSWRHQIQPLADAGYHVIVPNQRGYGNSSCPAAVEDYDINQLTADLSGLLHHYGYNDALFVGHDWGAIVTWNMALLHPERVAGLINFSVPLMVRGKKDWISFWEEQLGPDFYIVHFNRQPGVADKIFSNHAERFLRNMYRTEQWREEPVDMGEGMSLINLALASLLPGTAIMDDDELQVFLDAFKQNTFTPGLNWYRNFSRNWQILENAPTQVHCPSLMVYGQYDMVPQFPALNDYVPNLETATLESGHWIMQERPKESTKLMLDWLSRHYPA